MRGRNGKLCLEDAEMRAITSMACAMAIAILACGDASAAEKKYDTGATDR